MFVPALHLGSRARHQDFPRQVNSAGSAPFQSIRKPLNKRGSPGHADLAKGLAFELLPRGWPYPPRSLAIQRQYRVANTPLVNSRSTTLAADRESGGQMETQAPPRAPAFWIGTPVAVDICTGVRADIN